MTPLVLLTSLGLILPMIPIDPWNVPVVPACETYEVLGPGEVYDMVDWTTMDADLRATSHLSSENDPTAGYVLGTKVTADRITYLKTMLGDTWDVNVIDDLGIWSWRTETHWNTPRSYTQFRHTGQVLSSPRYAIGGYPGMRWVNCDSAYSSHNECGDPVSYGHLGYMIHELWGPYDYDPGYGDIRGKILKLAHYYGCSAPTTDSCTTVEVTWMHRRYGLFSWRQYDKKDGVWVLTNAPPVQAYVVPGVINEYFPCDQVAK